MEVQNNNKPSVDSLCKLPNQDDQVGELRTQHRVNVVLDCGYYSLSATTYKMHEVLCAVLAFNSAFNTSLTYFYKY